MQLNGKSGRFAYRVFAEYAFTRTTNESDNAKEIGSDGQQLIYIPEHTANGFLYGSAYGFYLSWSLNYVGERSTTLNPQDIYSGTLPDYFLNDVSIGKHWALRNTGLELRFRVNNIFNVDYQAILWRAMPGRNYEINLKFNIK
jgi:iron complex outermembrane receptor protein